MIQKGNNSPKILFLEARENLFGHKRQNEAIISCLSSFSELTVLFPKGWLENIPDNVEYIIHSPRILNIEKHVLQIKIGIDYIKKVSELDKQRRYDYIFFATYNIYALRYAVSAIEDSGNRLFVIHHSIMDQINESKIKRIFFDKIKNRLNNVNIEAFLAEELASGFGIENSRIFWFPHQLNRINRKYKVKYDYVALSNSNDEDWINEILKAEVVNNIFKHYGVRILIRSKILEYDDSYLKVFKGFLEDDIYYKYILESKVVLIPFTNDFVYRMSGSVVDAMSNNKKVVGKDIPVIRDYIKRYPNVCRIGLSVNDLIKYKEDGFVDENTGEEDFVRFIREHDNETMAMHFQEMFKS